MAWDLCISNFNDLVFSPHRDMQTVSGEDLLNQRIILRLKMKRGSWIFDEHKDLGSNLDFALQMDQPNAIESLEMLVAEALEPISDEIIISQVEVTPTVGEPRSLDLVLTYQRVIPPEATGIPILESQSLVLTIPVTV